MATVGKVNPHHPPPPSPALTAASSSSSSVSLVHVHNVIMECQKKTTNKQTYKQKKKQKKIGNRCCRCYGDGGQIHGRVWEGLRRP